MATNYVFLQRATTDDSGSVTIEPSKYRLRFADVLSDTQEATIEGAIANGTKGSALRGAGDSLLSQAAKVLFMILSGTLPRPVDKDDRNLAGPMLWAYMTDSEPSESAASRAKACGEALHAYGVDVSSIEAGASIMRNIRSSIKARVDGSEDADVLASAVADVRADLATVESMDAWSVADSRGRAALVGEKIAPERANAERASQDASKDRAKASIGSDPTALAVAVFKARGGHDLAVALAEAFGPRTWADLSAKVTDLIAERSAK